MWRKILLLFLLIKSWPLVLSWNRQALDTVDSSEGLVPVDQASFINDQGCQPVKISFCQIENGYNTIQPFKNSFGHNHIDEAAKDLSKYYYLFKLNKCGENIQLFLCSLYIPICPTSPSSELMPSLKEILKPCRKLCEQTKTVCEPHMLSYDNWLPAWDCSKFPTGGLCVDFTQEDHKTNNSPADNITDPQIPPGDLQASFPTLEPTTTTTTTSTSVTNSKSLNSTLSSGQCEPGEFDCRVKARPDKSSLMCIGASLVCNGLADCPKEDGALDEANCENNKLCQAGELSCDGRCLSPEDICNGKVDCVSGVDEQNCDAYIVNLVQSIICIIALCSLVYLIVKFFKIEAMIMKDYCDDDANDVEDHLRKTSRCSTHDNLNGEIPTSHRPVELVDEDTITQTIGKDTMSQLFQHHPEPLSPIYNTIAPSVMTRSDYEILAEGGYSGQASLYASHYGPFYEHSIMRDDHHTEPPEPPAAPPPTPALQQFYSTGSMTKSIDLYANMNDLHKQGPLG